ncbi:hypothetical protein FOMPIDRAFT_1051926 [Fomitopsis schrenkii]|uniref:Uncharacterized protein n=1 Tax=Fomitopsis schrenkii TaxID=2126942 RepID=S8DYA0_FOMSC|nr:hypothetical protein FOMPIDRAFT_1051926 [Fomitopsis schrenkii]
MPHQPAVPPPHDGFAPPYANFGNPDISYGAFHVEYSGSFVPESPFLPLTGSSTLLAG